MAREGEEATRVLYVAATRARDLLVVPALGDGRYDGWLQALTPVLYPSPDRVHAPETRQPPGCPAFGVETTTGRPDNVPRPADAVVPGLHVPEAGRHRVVWWDPATLALDVQESVGLAQQKILAVDGRGVRAGGAVRGLAHPLLRRAANAARAGRCRRECPVGVQVEGGVLVEGVIDAAFLEDGEGWTVVDFKTDVEIAGRLEEYRRQVGVYAEAVGRATGVRARGVLLR